MKRKFINTLHIDTYDFKSISFLTFIVYLICTSFGWINFILASYLNKVYYPLRSYIILFDKSDIKNLSAASTSIYNFSGFKSVISTDIPYKLINDLFFITLSLSLIFLFILGYKSLESKKIENLEIAKWSLVFSALMTLSIPAHSSDLYGYIARGAQQTIHHQNPYVHPVSDIKNYSQDPLFFNFMWPHQPTTYGPIFISFSKSLVFLSENNFLLSVLDFKILNLLIFSLLLAFLIDKAPKKDFYLIAFNPLIMIQGLWNCHNDLITGILIFIGLYSILNLKKKENVFWGAFALTAGVGVKYVPIFIIPFLIPHFKKKKDVLINIFIGIAAGIVLISIFSVDYMSGFGNINPENKDRLISNVDLVHKSLISTIFTSFKYLFKVFDLNIDFLSYLKALKLFFYSIFIGFYLYTAFINKSKLVYKIALVLFIFFTFTIAKFHSWYLLNIVFLTPLLKSDKESKLLKTLIVVISLMHIFSTTFIDQAKILNYIFMTILPIWYVLNKKELLKDF